MSMMQIRGNSSEGQYIGGIVSNISRAENVGETVSGGTEKAVQQNIGSEPKNNSIDEGVTLEISEDYFVFSDFNLQEKLDQVLNAAPDRETKEALDTAVWDIVHTYLMPRNIGDKTEEERLSLIEDGLKEAENLLEGLDENAAAALTEFMEGVAKYGREGKVGEDGSVVYDVNNPGWRKLYGQGNIWVRANTPELALETMAKEAPEEFQNMMELMKEVSQKNKEGDWEEERKLLCQAEVIYLKWAWKDVKDSPNSIYLAQQKRSTEQIEKAESDADRAKEKEKQKQKIALDVSAAKMRNAENKHFVKTQTQQFELQKTLYLMKSLGNNTGYDRQR